MTLKTVLCRLNCCTLLSVINFFQNQKNSNVYVRHKMCFKLKQNLQINHYSLHFWASFCAYCLWSWKNFSICNLSFRSSNFLVSAISFENCKHFRAVNTTPIVRRQAARRVERVKFPSSLFLLLRDHKMSWHSTLRQRWESKVSRSAQKPSFSWCPTKFVNVRIVNWAHYD